MFSRMSGPFPLQNDFLAGKNPSTPLPTGFQRMRSIGNPSALPALLPATPAWTPGHSLQGPKLSQEGGPLLENPILGVAVNTLTAIAAGFVATRSEGAISNISWVVTIISALRTFNDLSKLGIFSSLKEAI